jgi:hypothetical protein
MDKSLCKLQLKFSKQSNDITYNTELNVSQKTEIELSIEKRKCADRFEDWHLFKFRALNHLSIQFDDEGLPTAGRELSISPNSESILKLAILLWGEQEVSCILIAPPLQIPYKVTISPIENDLSKLRSKEEQVEDVCYTSDQAYKNAKMFINKKR